ncbi:MAG: FHA domain-containing protein [Agriterribacter sp.]
MKREEALEFLELSETATPYQVKQRLREKLAYYEDLSEKAPSDFLRKLNGRHALKVKDIQQQFPEWDPSKMEVSIEFPLEEVADIIAAEEEAGALTVPIIVSSNDKSQLIAKQKFPDPPGWLVLHTENKPSKTFALARGKNYMGRKAEAALNPFIVIEDDSFVSKVHAVILVEENETVDFFVMDDAVANGGKASSNGTYLNGDKARITQKTKLNEGDTVQVGVSKFILKINKNKIQDIVQEVKRSKFMHTVVVNKS